MIEIRSLHQAVKNLANDFFKLKTKLYFYPTHRYKACLETYDPEPKLIFYDINFAFVDILCEYEPNAKELKKSLINASLISHFKMFQNL